MARVVRRVSLAGLIENNLGLSQEPRWLGEQAAAFRSRMAQRDAAPS
jgi:hypothetical protein